MRLINYHEITGKVSAVQLYQYVKKFYEHIDIIQVSFDTVLDDIILRNLDPIKSVNKIFSNDYWKDIKSVYTPELITDLYLGVTTCEECVIDSFLDLCYHYGILIFVPDFLNKRDGLFTNLINFNWENKDSILKKHIVDNYYVTKTELDQKTMDKLIVSRKSISDFARAKEKHYKLALQRFPDLSVFDVQSLNYLYDEVL